MHQQTRALTLIKRLKIGESHGIEIGMNVSCGAVRLGGVGDESNWFNKNATCVFVFVGLCVCI